MAIKIQLRRDTAAQWTATNPILASGEEGHEFVTNKRKIGDGVTNWNSLPYIIDPINLVSIQQNTTDIENIQTEQTTQNTDIANIQTEQTTQNTDIANIQTEQTTQNTEISYIQTEQTTQNNAIDSNSTEISSLSNAQLALGLVVGTNTASIATKADDLTNEPDGNYLRRIVGGVTSWVIEATTTAGQWLSNAVGINYSSGNVGLDTESPAVNLQVGPQHNDVQTSPARIQNAAIKVYGGTATNNGSATLGLYESVPQAFTGDYGVFQRYDGATNLWEFVTVQAGVETVAFTFDRATQVSNFFKEMSLNSQQITNVANPTTAQGAMTAILSDAIKVRNTLPLANVNTGITAVTGLTGGVEMPSEYGQFTAQDNGITPQFTGFAELLFTAFMSGSATRAAPSFRWSTGTQVGPFNAETYIRNASGHNEATAKVVAIVPCTNGQQIQVQHDSLAGGGTVTVAANDIEFSLKRIR